MRHGEAQVAGQTKESMPSTQICEAHWRLTLMMMRLVGMLGCSGWPLRCSRAWTWYACVVLVVFAGARLALWCHLGARIVAAIEAMPREVKFTTSLFLSDFFIKNSLQVLVQMAILYRSRDVSLLVRAIFLSKHSFPDSSRKSESRKVALVCFGISPLFYCFAVIYMMVETPQSLASWLFQVLLDVLPVVTISITQDSFMVVVSASIDGLAIIADGVKNHTDGLSRIASSAPEATLWSRRPCEIMCLCTERDSQQDAPAAVLDLRALRVRYQCVHDATHVANTLYGFFNLAFITMTIYEGVVCLYAGIVALFGLGKMGDFEAFWTLMWGTVLTSKLIFICMLGDQMRVEDSRILTTLQTGMAHCPDTDPQRREIKKFMHQIHMQDIRFGAFDLIYYDLETLKRVIAAVMTFLVVIIQFSAISNSKQGSQKPNNKTYTNTA